MCIYIYIHTHHISHIYHSFFIHFSVNRHLGYFHVLTIVNTAAMNNQDKCNLQIMIFLQIHV